MAKKIALAYGFVLVGQRGSHQYFAHTSKKVTIPVRKEYPIGTAKAILDEIAKTKHQTWRDVVLERNLKI